MNKKEYNAPDMEVVKIQTAGMLAVSGEKNVDVDEAVYGEGGWPQ